MKKQLVKINGKEITVKEYHGQRVVTFKDIDECHGRPMGTAGRNFRTNRQHMVEGTDYFKITPDEFRRTIGDMDSRQQNDVTLITESGYLMLVKSFTDDLAWDVQRQLVNSYFGKGSNDSSLKLQVQQERAHAMLINARARMFKEIMKVADNHKLSPIAAEVFGITALEQATGKKVDYRPPCDATYSASDIAEELGTTANRVGRIANSCGLKTDDYGENVMDKSRYSAKEVSAFRYNEKGKLAIKQAFERSGEAHI